MKLSEKLKDQRLYLGYKIDYVSLNVKSVSESQLKAFESGKSNPTCSQLLGLAEFYKTTVFELMEERPMERPVFLFTRNRK